jgi:hypothetical protein
MHNKRENGSLETTEAFDLEIERLIYVGTVIRALIKHGVPLLDAREFPRSSDAMSQLSEWFDSELEVNLLRTYERGSTPGRPG